MEAAAGSMVVAVGSLAVATKAVVMVTVASTAMATLEDDWEAKQAEAMAGAEAAAAEAMAAVVPESQR